MADAIPFRIRNNTNAPVTGAEGSFTRTAWNGLTGAPRTPATIVAVVGEPGAYELRTTDADAVAAAVTLVDFGVGRNPRRLLFSVCKPDKTNQVLPLFFTDATGALWTGTGGTVSGWTGPIPPTIFKLADGVFVVRPSADDIAADASGFVVPQVGALPAEGYDIGVEPLGESPDLPLPPQPPTPIVSGQESGARAAGDIRLFVDEFLRADVKLVANDLVTDEGLETALLLSLFIDRYDEHTEDPTQRRGYWADGLNGVDRWGSRLWKLDRAKIGPGTLDEMREYAREATQWFIDERIAERIEFTPAVSKDGWSLVVAIHRPNDTARSFRYARQWAAQESR